jgi:hypothetical protein
VGIEGRVFTGGTDWRSFVAEGIDRGRSCACEGSEQE